MSFFILLFGIFAGIVQAVINFAREAILVVLAGLLPLAAAAGLTDKGRGMRDRYLGWLMAFVLYKPAAATVWAGTFLLFEDAKGIDGAITALVMMVVTCIALPAVMRVAVPAIAAMGESKTGGGLLGMAGHRIATGAAYMGGRSRSRKTSGTKTDASSQSSRDQPAQGAAKDSGAPKQPDQGSGTSAQRPSTTSTSPSAAPGGRQQLAGSTATPATTTPATSMHPAGAAASAVASTARSAKQHTAEAITPDSADGAEDDEGPRR